MGEIRFVGTGDTRGYPYLVCKKIFYREVSLPVSHIFCVSFLRSNMTVSPYEDRCD